MLNRREFIKNTAAFTAAGLFVPAHWLTPSPLLGNIAVQFFSLPKLLEKDMPGTLRMLAGLGYKEVELFGPYTFSADSAHQSWNAVTPMLGFKGCGFFGHTITEVKKMLDDNGLTAPSMHTDLDTLQTQMPALAEAANALGCQYVTLPSIPDSKRKSMDDYKQMAEQFNGIGEAAKKEGIKFAYHNHGYGITPVNGQVPLQLLLDATDASLVFLEMDLFWTVAGGADPVDYLTKYKNRYHLMHVKDMSKKARFSGDGSTPQQWVELFPLMTTAGNGVLDLKTILTAAKENGMKHYVVEQDIAAEPEAALKKSIDYLKTL